MFKKHNEHTHICQIQPYYSNYNTFHITAILEVKKSSIPENYVEKQWLAKPLIIIWYFHNCIQMFSVSSHSFVLLCFFKTWQNVKYPE